MSSLRRRLAAMLIGAAAVATVAALMIAGQAPASRTAGVFAAIPNHPVLTPFSHPTPRPGQQLYAGPSGAADPWTPLVNPPPFPTPGTMLLESDGTVLVHDEPDGVNGTNTSGTPTWWKLTPSYDGSYVDGSWSPIASMPSDYGPLYFGSAILPDGRMIVEGGEYNLTGVGVWTNKGAIYNPVTNTWTAVAPPPGWSSIGDSASEVLADGTFMLQHPCNTCTTDPELTVDDALLNAKNLTWKVIPATGKEDPNDEEGWTLEPSGQLLTVETWAIGNTQLFNPSSDTWSFAGATAPGGNPVDPFPIVEMGPQVEMPGGNVFVVGGGTSTFTSCSDTGTTSTETALYHYKAGTAGKWTAGPEIPPIGDLEYDSTDGPGSILPDGNVLFDVSPCVYSTPTHFFVYDASSNSLSQIPDAPNAINDTSYATRMLALPNGQVLYDDGSNQMEVYTAGGTPKPSWAPSITSVSSTTIAPGHNYSLSGKQLAGLDQGAAYGDDVQDNTNFPLVRITNDATGVVTYARTFNWSSVSVAPGTSSSTQFTIPSTTPTGKSKLVAVANGIASAPVTVTIS